MRVLYDHQIFIQNYGGISRYFFELMRHFKSDPDIDFKLSLKFSNNHYLSNLNYLNYSKFLEGISFKGKARLINFINRINTIYNLKKEKFDIFHPTYYNPYFLKHIGDKPFVLTVYDMIHEKFSDYFPEKDKTSNYKKILCQKASKIIAISENTKKDLISLFRIPEYKIKVIYLASSIQDINPTKNIKLSLPEKYILFVGNRSGYKNWEFFIRSSHTVLKDYKDISLICAGGGKFNKNEMKLLKDLDVTDKVLHIPISSDEMLSYLYKNAYCFVFPSLYEGFGIPVLESFSCNCPVVCSNTSSFPEIAKDAALYFNPKSEKSIQNAIDIILNDKKLRTGLINAGKERVKEFSWEKCTYETKIVYNEIIG